MLSSSKHLKKEIPQLEKNKDNIELIKTGENYGSYITRCFQQT